MTRAMIPTDAQIDHETNTLVVGGGPVGMFSAWQLAQLGEASILVERNETTTVHPKMEYISHRSMEIYRQIGLMEHLKKKSVADHHGFAEVFVTGLGPKNYQIVRLDALSRTEYHEKATEENDGTWAREPSMRMMQADYEVILKDLTSKNKLITSFWRTSFESLVEYDDGVLSTVVDASGGRLVIKSRYVLGCDGAGSRVRLAAGLQSPRHSLPLNLIYIHFKSKDREKMLSKGDFWHAMLIDGCIIIAQDEVETYTLHKMIPPGITIDVENPVALLQQWIGGMAGPLDVKIDEVVLTGRWQSDLSLASSFRSEKGRVFLAGDAAHQLTPAGGHGLNSGIQDAHNLTWKLAAVLGGWGGEKLLDSYSKERRPVAQLNISMVEKATMDAILPNFTKANELGAERLLAPTPEGDRDRETMKEYLARSFWVHQQNGTVMGYRYNGSPTITADESVSEPRSEITKYIPSSWPGARPPHVMLRDGTTSIFDQLGAGFTVVDFTASGAAADQFAKDAAVLDVPMRKLHLPDESHCRGLWERDVVLVRPDGFVAWRCPPDGVASVNDEMIRNALLTAAGR